MQRENLMTFSLDLPTNNIRNVKDLRASAYQENK